MKKEIKSMSPLTTLSNIPDWLFLCLMSISTFFSPMIVQLLFLLLFVIIDLISGLMVSRKLNIKFSFSKLWNTFAKLISYTLITTTGFIFDYIFIKEAFGAPYMFNIFMLLLCLNEFRSIINNFSKVLGYDIWNLVIKSFSKKKDLE